MQYRIKTVDLSEGTLQMEAAPPNSCNFGILGTPKLLAEALGADDDCFTNA